MFNQTKGLLQFLPPLKWWVSLQLYHETDANDFYTSIGRDFRYSIPFKTLLEYNEHINENLNRIIAIEKQKGVVHTKDQLMEFAMYHVGQSPWLHRKSINRGLL